LMALLYLLLQKRAGPLRVMNQFFWPGANFSAAGHYGFSCTAQNDAQKKTMGIIALTLLAATKAGQLEHLPVWLSFLHTPETRGGARRMEIRLWIKIVCALTMASGTAVGGWRIIKNARAQNGEVASDQWFCRRSELCDGDPGCNSAWNSSQHNTQHLRCNNGGRRGATPQRDNLKWSCGRTHGLGMDFDDTGHWRVGVTCLCGLLRAIG